jgi:FdrA protein
MALISKRLGPVYSNVPLRPEWALPGPAGAHRCLDLGEEEFTSGRPHPMIDVAARVEHIERAAEDPATAVILLDVVLGYGSHPDPASVLGPACERAGRGGRGPGVVTYVLGTEGDPQNRQQQEQTLADAGCILAPTGARAALLAAAIAARRPQIAEETP